MRARGRFQTRKNAERLTTQDDLWVASKLFRVTHRSEFFLKSEDLDDVICQRLM
jgi:hypothetical protein